MKEPLYEEFHELFECPDCQSSVIKYRFLVTPNGDVEHWGECDFSLCRKIHELRYLDERPDSPDSLMVVKNLTREQVLQEIFKRDPVIQKASERLKELSEDPEFVMEYLRREEELRGG